MLGRRRAPQIRKLAEDGGPLQLTLFDEQDLAEISSPDYPGERLIACRNPALAAERARKRGDLLTATETLLATIKAAVDDGRLPTRARPRTHSPTPTSATPAHETSD